MAKVVAFLLSDEASYLNGQTIAIDGGESKMYGNKPHRFFLTINARARYGKNS